MSSVGFIHLFSEFLANISPILIKFDFKIFHENSVDFTCKEKIHCRLLSINFFVTNSG